MSPIMFLLDGGRRLPGRGAGDLLYFRPAGFDSPYGAVSRIQFQSELVELEAGSLAHHSHDAMKMGRFAEPVWVIGYRTEVVNARGEKSARFCVTPSW